MTVTPAAVAATIERNSAEIDAEIAEVAEAKVAKSKASVRARQNERVSTLIRNKGLATAQGDMLYGTKRIGYMEAQAWVAAISRAVR